MASDHESKAKGEIGKGKATAAAATCTTLAQVDEKAKGEGVPRNTLLQYVIAGVVIGGALGNIALARRMRTFVSSAAGASKAGKAGQKDWSETVEAAREAARAAHKERMDNLDGFQDELRRRRQRWAEQEMLNEEIGKVRNARLRWHSHRAAMRAGLNLRIPLSVMTDLRTLELPPNDLPTKEQLKEAYRKLARKYHPDVLDKNDPTSADLQHRFAAVTSAYAAVLKHLES